MADPGGFEPQPADWRQSVGADPQICAILHAGGRLRGQNHGVS